MLQAVLRFICEAAKPRTNRLGPSPAFLAFYGVLVCEVLATSKVTPAACTTQRSSTTNHLGSRHVCRLPFTHCLHPPACVSPAAISSLRTCCSSMRLQVTEDLVALLLPYMLAGLPRDADVGYRSATLMIVVQLAATATLADSLFEGAFPPCKGSHKVSPSLHIPDAPARRQEADRPI